MSDFEGAQSNAETIRLYRKSDRVEWMKQVDPKTGEGWAGDVLEDQKHGNNVLVHLDGKNYFPFGGEWLEAKNLNLLSEA